MFRFDNKVALVTGSAQNLGKAMIEDFAAQGADIAVSNRSNTEKLNQTVDELDEKYDVDVVGVQMDISDEDSVADAVEEIHDSLGPIDILVNNVAVRPYQSLESMTKDDWQAVIDVNLTGTFNCTKAVLPDMKENEWGRVISISGVDAYTGNANRIHNVTSKAGILGFTRALANEVPEYNITANCVIPGSFDTSRDPEKYPELEYRYQLRKIATPLARIGSPDELSPAVLFFASEEASFITGQVLHVNGGRFPTLRSYDKLADDDIEKLHALKFSE